MTSFRFLQLFGIKHTAAAPLSQEADREEAKAAQEHEQVDVNLAARKLSSEVAQWLSYKEKVTMWQSKHELEQRVQLTDREEKNKVKFKEGKTEKEGGGRAQQAGISRQEGAERHRCKEAEGEARGRSMDLRSEEAAAAEHAGGRKTKQPTMEELCQ